MLQAGDQFISGRSGGVVCAFLPWRGAAIGIAPAHVFCYSGTDRLRLGDKTTRVMRFSKEADLAFFPVLSPCRMTDLGRPTLGQGTLANSARRMGCRFTEVSWSIAYMMLQPGDLPGPGDSGTPIFQNERVVGMLISINLGTCKGTAITGNYLQHAIEELNSSP
ncbi:MAG: hypothetical protein A4E45_00166 [Methanosaeta sp. PtaB.Bin039]|mgnify:CR=1 FL=1|nr:MAG: hypothetical protein A4E45_00166 [Methanosaeta sp. PtaB.Bin039]OPY45210.1 MAG: hypothetical protein A4E47_01064 [Methanosaeta sp. PtaU1.Bin028]HQF16622.1 hypothetical protein [Methanotrichaceae archaeon]HQI91254.1 hypothetical protein [Methanotrichaceae archaeon]HQJ61698.1 hypothetical protein [Methanothrix soehngenii]